MTEAEWLTCAEPVPMLEHLRAGITKTVAGRRKLRLLACAFVRRFWDVMVDEWDRNAVLVAERYADGEADKTALLEAREAARDYRTRKRTPKAGGTGTSLTWPAQLAAVASAWDAACHASRGCADTAWLLARDSGPHETEKSPSHTGARRAHADLVRDLFGDPFRPAPAAIAPAWLVTNDGAARRMAEAAYQQRQFDRLPILADALEEAGCADGAILSHLRGPGAHARGCWCVDLLLGKG
jgi:hypothetical protein